MDEILLAETLDEGARFIAEHPEHAGRFVITPRSAWSRADGRYMDSIVTTPAFDAMCADGRGWGWYAQRLARMCHYVSQKRRRV